MVSEYTLALGKDLPTNEAQGWAQYMQDRNHENGTMGSAIWQWRAPERRFWSMHYLGTEGGIDWAKIYGAQSQSSFYSPDLFLQ